MARHAKRTTQQTISCHGTPCEIPLISRWHVACRTVYSTVFPPLSAPLTCWHIISYIIAPHAVISSNEYWPTDRLLTTYLGIKSNGCASRLWKAKPLEKRIQRRSESRRKAKRWACGARKARGKRWRKSKKSEKPVIRLAEAAYKLPLSDTCD